MLSWWYLILPSLTQCLQRVLWLRILNFNSSWKILLLFCFFKCTLNIHNPDRSHVCIYLHTVGKNRKGFISVVLGLEKLSTRRFKANDFWNLLGDTKEYYHITYFLKITNNHIFSNFVFKRKDAFIVTNLISSNRLEIFVNCFFPLSWCYRVLLFTS